MERTLAKMRQDYESKGLIESDVLADPIEQFRRWFDEACAATIHEPNAMMLATVSPEGQPSARMVLLKQIDQRGLTFFTNLGSRKAQDLAANPKAALSFWWGPLARQVRFEGVVGPVEAVEADAYFASRPLDSKIGAWASPQSRPIESRDVLDQAERACRARFPEGVVPRPPFWGGYRLTPHRVEFWQGRAARLHDRLLYDCDGTGSWRLRRLAP